MLFALTSPTKYREAQADCDEIQLHGELCKSIAAARCSRSWSLKWRGRGVGCTTMLNCIFLLCLNINQIYPQLGSRDSSGKQGSNIPPPTTTHLCCMPHHTQVRVCSCCTLISSQTLIYVAQLPENEKARGGKNVCVRRQQRSYIWTHEYSRPAGKNSS